MTLDGMGLSATHSACGNAGYAATSIRYFRAYSWRDSRESSSSNVWSPRVVIPMGIRASVIHGLHWTAGGKLMAQLLTWGITIVVMRLLAPDDYGVMAMATFVGTFI